MELIFQTFVDPITLPFIHYNIHDGCICVHSCLECALSQCREGEGPWIFSLTAVRAVTQSV